MIAQQVATVAIAWNVCLLTRSPLQMGPFGLLRAAPFMALSFVNGAVAAALDRD